MGGVGAFIVLMLVLAMLVSFAGAAGLFVLHRRRARLPVGIAVPSCPRCRHAVDPERAGGSAGGHGAGGDGEGRQATCPECGADLAASGVIDAAWPRRRHWVLRGVFVLMLALPFGVLLERGLLVVLPQRFETVTLTVLGVADEAGVPREAVVLGERWTWFGAGRRLSPVPVPADVGARTWLALPPDAPAQRMTAPEDDLGMNPPAPSRDALGDAAYRRVSREEAEAVAALAVGVADQIAASGEAAASAAAGRSGAPRGAGTGSNSFAGPSGAGHLGFTRWLYGELRPGTVVPLARRTWHRSRSLLPPQGVVVLGVFVVAAGLLARGSMLARRYRPRPLA